VRVALDGALGDVEQLGELRNGQLSPGLEREEEGDETTRAHAFERTR